MEAEGNITFGRLYLLHKIEIKKCQRFFIYNKLHMEINMSQYYSLEEAMNMVSPQTIDYVEFDYKDIHYRVYGFLHGISGAPNEEYRRIVRNSVCEAPGLIIGEQGLNKKAVNLGIPYSLNDFLPVGFKMATRIGWKMSLFSKTFWHIMRTAIVEKTNFANPMTENRLHGLVDLCNSSNFHLIEPHLRRKLAGFPSSKEYLELNIARKYHDDKTLGPRFPVHEWRWLTDIEPYADIPLRSIHMLEYSNTLAKLLNQDTVSLFVGETHQTDMLWLANNGLNEISTENQKICHKVMEQATSFASKYKKRLPVERLVYGLGIATGGSLPFITTIFALFGIYYMSS